MEDSWEAAECDVEAMAGTMAESNGMQALPEADCSNEPCPPAQFGDGRFASPHSGASAAERCSGGSLNRLAHKALTKPAQARRLRPAAARITGRYALLGALLMSSDSHPRPGSMTQLARA
ncbi:hypothetical protein ASF73_17555 [Xanthomonas sp. Leaf131]|nr:hypothetical protein ASF73_17555 [Xanthomonas sp. Leaf131]